MIIKSGVPKLSGVGLLALVPECWRSFVTVRHQVMARLAHYFQVLWIEPAQELREALRFGRVRYVAGTAMPPPPGLRVFQADRWPLKVYRPSWAARWLFGIRLRRASDWLRRSGCKWVVLYLWRPSFSDALDLIAYDLSCYHLDDEYAWDAAGSDIDPREQALIARVDQVFIHSPGLFEKKGRINPYTDLVPNGVDYAAYVRPYREPSDLRMIPHPRIGYTGRLKKQLDWPLLTRLIAEHPEWSFVFVGDVAPHAEVEVALRELRRHPNAYFLGAKSVTELPAYPQHFDVCIMPYRSYEYTRYIYPLKLHEYLASGRPVVGTQIRSLEEFAEVVLLVNHPDEWSAAIEGALRPDANTLEQRKVRQAIAQQHDWDRLVLRLALTLAGRLSPELADHIRKPVQLGKTDT